MLNQKQTIFLNQVKAAINSFELNNAIEITITKALTRNHPSLSDTNKAEAIDKLESSTRTLRFIISAFHLLIDSAPIHRLFTDHANTNRLPNSPEDPFIAAATFFQFSYALVVQRYFNDNQIHSFKWVHALLSNSDMDHIPDYVPITESFRVKSTTNDN